LLKGDIMDRYLIAIDLDGTLLYDFDTISDKMTDFMKKVQSQGHRIVIATGRPFRSSRFAYEKFGLDTPIINYNGGLVTHPRDRTFPIVNVTARKDAIIDIFESNIEHIRNAFCEVRDSIFLFREEKEIEPLLHVGGSTGIHVGHLKDTLVEDTNGAIIIGKQGHGKYIADYVDKKYNGEILTRIWDIEGEYDSIVEIYTEDSDKGKALKYVANLLGYERKNVIAIGDGHNDIGMLAYAGIGAAVSNSNPALLETADLILPGTARDEIVGSFLGGYLNIAW